MEDFRVNQEADVVANLRAADHAPHEPSADWLHWELVAKAVRNFWLVVGLDRSCVRVLRAGLVSGCQRLCVSPLFELPAEMLPRAPHEVSPHKRVVEYNDFVCCLVCYRQTHG
eukprot:4837428-Amphidinium_carterae.3